MKAVIYARYSSNSQRDESIDGQIRECTAYAQRYDIQIVGEYIDRAISGRRDDRPDFQRMIKDISKNTFDCILVWKLDRFAHDKYDSAHYKRILRNNNIRLISVTEPIPEGPEGILLESLLEGMAQYYSAELSVKVIRGHMENAYKCRFNGGTIPIGYNITKDKYFEINPLTAPFVLQAFELYDAGDTMQEIADKLNAQGLRHYKHGTELSVNSISSILSNRRYIGDYRYRDVFVPDGIPAIVPKDLFERVQKKLVINKHAPSRCRAVEDYILTTKLFCGHCMATMIGVSGTSQTGDVHRYYKCNSVIKDKSCNKKSVKKDWIEDIVIEQIKKIIFNDDFINHLTEKVLEKQKEDIVTPLYEKQLSEINRSIANLIGAIENGISTKSTKARLENLEKEKEQIEVRIATSKIVHNPITREQINNWFDKLKNLKITNIKTKKRLVDLFVNSIILYDDRIDFHFNFKEGSNTLYYKRITESSLLTCSLPPSVVVYLDATPKGLEKSRLFAFFTPNFQVAIS
ncbi:MAG: recombinase family protein [Clostridia bacterium]|nr:recombinase family protein [Clostridia bacterium]